jgi:hypothetical protein
MSKRIGDFARLLFLISPMTLFLSETQAIAQPADTLTDESKVPKYTLPDLMTALDGTKIETVEAWRTRRRPEILRLFEEHIHGKTVGGRPQGMKFIVTEEDKEALGGKATRRQVTILFREDGTGPQIDLLMYIPNGANAPVPAFLGLNFQGNHSVHADAKIRLYPRWVRSGEGVINNRATEAARGCNAHRWQLETVIDRGYALATACYCDADPDTSQDDFSDGIHPLFYEAGQTRPANNEWGAVGAWAWGLSRALDYLATEPAIDATRVAVLGHSRLGKTSLWAGAQDERFALVISNNSGEGGAALFRRRFGERIDHMIKNRISYWFSKNFESYANRENELPVDMHMLIALMAPRPVYVASAEEDLWADPRGEFLSARLASPVYELYGLEGLPTEEMPRLNEPVHGTIGYHIRSGAHDVIAYDWEQYLRFADRHFAKAAK